MLYILHILKKGKKLDIIMPYRKCGMNKWIRCENVKLII